MKNLKVNKEAIKKLVGTALIMTSLTNLAGCSFSQKGEPITDNTESLESVIVDNKVIKIVDLKLKDTKTGNVVDTIDKVIIDNKLVEYTKLADVLFNPEIESVLIGDELVPVSRLVLVDEKTGKEIKAIDYVIDGDELVPAKNLTLSGRGDKNDSVSETTSILEKDEEYEELTTEKFEELVAARKKDLKDKGILVSDENLIKYVMIVNIDKLAQDNPELIQEIVSSQLVDEVQQDAYDTISAIVMNNYNNWYANHTTEGNIKVSPFIFDKNQREIVAGIEKCVDAIAVLQDVSEKNTAIHSLLLDLTNPQSDFSCLESGPVFALQTVLEPIRGLYGYYEGTTNSLLDETNNELIKYFVPYAEDGQEYVDNNMLTGAILNIHDILSDNRGCSKSLRP